jgi:hypothetical protein
MMRILTVRRTLLVLLLPALGLASSNARADDAPVLRRETWFVEGGFGVSQHFEDAYVQRLRDFKFEPDLPLFEFTSHTETVGYMFTENLGLLLRHDLLESRVFTRSLTDEGQDEFEWNTHAVSLGARARKPLYKEWFALYAQANLGLGFALSRYQNYGQSAHEDSAFGVSFGLLGGADVNFAKYAGMFVEAGYNHAPVLQNRFGDRHNDGGAMVTFGIRVRLLQEK